jgi:uncharacterized protein (UPF0332 family)
MSLKDETIKLKLSKAHSLLLEIDVMMTNKFYTSVVSRLYYSCFHATKALLLTKDLMPKTHKGTSTILHQNFVNTGLFNNDKAIFFDKLMEERIEDDYNDFMIFDESKVIGFIEPAKQYIEYVTKLIETYFDAPRNESTNEFR